MNRFITSVVVVLAVTALAASQVHAQARSLDARKKKPKPPAAGSARLSPGDLDKVKTGPADSLSGELARLKLVEDLRTLKYGPAGPVSEALELVIVGFEVRRLKDAPERVVYAAVVRNTSGHAIKGLTYEISTYPTIHTWATGPVKDLPAKDVALVSGEFRFAPSAYQQRVTLIVRGPGGLVRSKEYILVKG